MLAGEEKPDNPDNRKKEPDKLKRHLFIHNLKKKQYVHKK